MQANSVNHPFYRSSDSVLDMLSDGASSDLATRDASAPADNAHAGAESSVFQGQFENCMEMYADVETVARYLDNHHDWFQRCARPMTADPLGENGYALTIGKFGSFGYEVEPKVGLDLLPQDEGVYRIQTISIPDYTPPGYDVDFRASLQLAAKDPASLADSDGAQPSAFTPSAFTNVEWELDLKVTIHFPRFINALPHSLIQGTGDRLLNQIVRQVSKRLTYKVQQDFHQTMGIPFSRPRRAFWR